MKLIFWGSFLFLSFITKIPAQNMFSISGGVNWGVLELESATQYNSNVNLAVGMFDSKIRLGLRYSRYGVVTDFENFKFGQGGVFIQFGYKFIDRLRTYLEVTYYKGDYGQDINLYPVVAKNSSYIAGGGGIEFRIYKFIHLVMRLQSMKPINHGIDYPKGYSYQIPSANIGLQLIF